MFKYWVYKFGQFWVTRLPLKVSYRLAVFLSDFHYYFSFVDRRAVKENLKVIVPGRNRVDVLAQTVFRNFGKYLVEFFRMTRDVNANFIKERVRVGNIERISEVLKEGKGAILLTAHIGNWELGGVILSYLGYPTLAIALPHKERPVNNLFNQQREHQGLEVVPLHLAIRKSLEALNQNKCVAVLADRNFTGSGEVLDFLGRKVLFPKGPAIFSLRTGAPILPTFLIRDETRDHHFIMIVEEPIYPSAKGGGEEDHHRILSLMKRYAAVIEEKVRQYPTQWLMFRRFWVE